MNMFPNITREAIVRSRLAKTRGFTLMELMISMALGLLILGSALLMYKQAVNGEFVTSEKSEMQQDFRAAANLMQRDISMAGSGSLGQAGLAANSIGLPTGTGSTVPVYPCSATACTYVNGTSVAYPTVSGAPYLYSIMPGYDLGITVNAATGASDIITVAYADANLMLNCYVYTVTSATTVTFQLPTTLPATCILPPYPSTVTAPPVLNDPVVGLQPGDYIVFGQAAAGVVTNITVASPASGYSAAYTVTFNSGDPGHIDQPTITNGTLKSLVSGSASTLSAVRMLIITYYLDISPIDGVTPRLMRIQNGKTPVPVAENVTNLKFSYDVDNGGVVTANLPSLTAGITPNMITKVNILHMTIRSQLHGASGYQGLDLQTSICARNLTMGQEYQITGSSY
jgi:prepilin-type N-terminal cleavage/methylation domain-containing protein